MVLTTEKRCGAGGLSRASLLFVIITVGRRAEERL